MTDWNAAPPPRDRTVAAGLAALVGSLAFAALVLPAILPVYERAAYRRATARAVHARLFRPPTFSPPPRLDVPDTPAPPVATCDPARIKPDDDEAAVPPPPVGQPPPATVHATLRLSQGTVRIEMYGDRAACTVTSMTYLARRGFFDGTVCHRVTTGGIYVLQCGDPTGTGAGGPGYTVADENTKGATYPAGTVALARTFTPDTGGSQFFLVYRDAPLAGHFTVFGRITEGLDVIREIAANGTEDGSTDGRPKQRVTVESFTIDRRW